MSGRWDRIWVDARLARMTAVEAEPYAMLEHGAIAAKDGKIAWLGAMTDLPDAPDALAEEVVACEGACITPALIDCHTHLVFAGDRAGEYALRLEGASYEEIARAGGGILSTVNAVRAAEVNDLVEASLPRLDSLIADGVATVEIKSGYGLNLDGERAMLEAAGRLAEMRRVRVRRTFLGAHALPPEFVGRSEEYITYLCEEMLPALAADGLVDAVDAFCERIGFSPAQTERVFQAACAHGLPVKLHAEQLSNQRGASLAARYKALSADHLEFLDEEGVADMAAAGAVAVILPCAYYFLRDETPPPIEKLRAAGVDMAVATDCNPGSSPCASLLLAMNMACALFRMTPAEALAGATRNASKALGLGDETGTLEVGKACDLAVWDIAHPAELSYWMGLSPLRSRVVAGSPDTETIGAHS